MIVAIKGSAEYQELVKKDPTQKLDKNASASVVAEWLSQNVNGTASTASSSDGTRVAPGDVLYEIAAAVSGMKQGVKAETAAGDPLNAGTPWTRPNTNEAGLYGDGYYLFVSDGLTNQAKPNTGTSPIFAIVGGDPVVVTEKTSIPRVDKKILDDTAGKDAADAEESYWKNSGDAWIGQEIDYRLTGSVADNIASYGTYYYEFQDTLSKGLIVIKGENNAPEGLHVYIVDGKTKAKTEVKSGFSANVAAAQDTVKNSELLTVLSLIHIFMNDVDTGGTIQLGKDGSKITLDLNGHKIKHESSSQPLFNITGGATLTVMDSQQAEVDDPTGDKYVCSDNTSSKNGNLASVAPDETSNIPTNLTYYVTGSSVNPDGISTTEALYKHEATIGGAIVACSGNDQLKLINLYGTNGKGGTFNLESGVLTQGQGCKVANLVYAENGSTVNMSGGYVCGASTGTSGTGAGIMVSNEKGAASTLNLTGGVIAGNYAPNGGGVYAKGCLLYTSRCV